jgi:hypothetical protein
MPYNGSDNITKLVWSFAKATSGLVGMTHSKAGQEIIDVSLSEAMTVFLKDNKYFEEDGSPMGYNPGVMTMIVNNIKEGLGMPDADKLNLAIDLFNPNTVR